MMNCRCSSKQKCVEGLTCTHEDKCASEQAMHDVKHKMPEEHLFIQLKELFKAMGSQTRLKIIYTLMEVNELCVEHLADAVNMSLSAVSHQLKVLRQLRLVKARKQAQSVYYSLDDQHIAQLFTTACVHLRENGFQ